MGTVLYDGSFVMELNTDILFSVRDSIDWSKPQWLVLEECYRSVKDSQDWTASVSVGRPLRSNAVDVVERIGKDVLFWYQRDVFGPGRDTSIDRYGLIGLSTFNLLERKVIVTEGVSDFLSVKMCCPNLNVLGFTTLGGNLKSVKILLTLADQFVFISDNDFGKEKNTGLVNSMNLRKLYESYGKKVTVLFPKSPNKDITQQILNDIKIRSGYVK